MTGGISRAERAAQQVTGTTWQRPPWPAGPSWEYHPPPLSVCDPEDTYPLLTGKDEDIGVRLRTYEGRLVDYALWHNVDTPIDGRREVSHADCRHGHVHWHLNRRSGGLLSLTSLRDINRVEDIDAAYGDAVDAIYGRRDDNRRRWAHG